MPLVTGFTPDPYLVSIVAGGDSAASDELGAACAGNVTSKQPDVVLNYTAGANFGLYLYAEAVEDTTLILLGPDGWHCDDDSHGDLNPGVSLERPLSGDYLIWVGTFDGGVADAELGISVLTEPLLFGLIHSEATNALCDHGYSSTGM